MERILILMSALSWRTHIRCGYLLGLLLIMLAGCSTHSVILPPLDTPKQVIYQNSTAFPQTSDHLVFKYQRQTSLPPLFFIPPYDFSVQALDLNAIKYLRIWVKGSGIASEMWNENGHVNVSNTQEALLYIKTVPKGMNRIVTAQAYDADQVPIPGARLKGFYNSSAFSDRVQVSLSWRSYPVGSILEHLLTLGSSLASTLNATQLQDVVDTVIYGNQTIGGNNFAIHPSRFNTEALAKWLDKNKQIPNPQTFTELGLINLNQQFVAQTPQNTAFNQNIQLSFNDPASSTLIIPAGNDRIPLTHIAPGNWNALASILGPNGGVQAQTSITVLPNGTINFGLGSSANPLILPPLITSAASPTRGIGNSIIVSGDGFNNGIPANNQVRFGSSTAQVSAASANSLRVNIPTDFNGNDKIRVNIGSKISNYLQFNQLPIAQTQAMWVFSDELTNPARRQLLVDRAAASSTNLLYLSIYKPGLNPNANNAHMFDYAFIADLVSKAAQKGIEVWAAYGSSDWIDADMGCNAVPIFPRPFAPLNLMQEVIDYNTANPGAILKGVILDVEPPNPVNFQALLDLYECSRTLLQANNLKASAAIRTFWPDLVEYPNGSGNNKEAYKHIIDLPLNQLVVMGYRDYAGTTCPDNGLLCLNQDEMAYAGGLGKTKHMLIGVETQDCPGSGLCIALESFYEEGLETMEVETTKVAQAYAANVSFGGFAVHRYDAAYLGNW